MVREQVYAARTPPRIHQTRPRIELGVRERRVHSGQRAKARLDRATAAHSPALRSVRARPYRDDRDGKARYDTVSFGSSRREKRLCDGRRDDADSLFDSHARGLHALTSARGRTSVRGGEEATSSRDARDAGC